MNLKRMRPKRMKQNPSPTLLALGGFPIESLTYESLSTRLEYALDSNQQTSLFFANTNFVVKCQSMRESILASNCIITNDGIGLDIAALLIHQQRFPENLCGTDFVPPFLTSINHKARVYLLGAKPGIAERAAKNLADLYHVNVVGTCDGYAPLRDVHKVIASINASQANIVLVAMGNPLQEKWILDHQRQLNANVFMGVGALIDFIAGDKQRAPTLVRKFKLEWLYRLCLEPTRLVRRYTVDIGVFLALCINAEFHRTKRAQKT